MRKLIRDCVYDHVRAKGEDFEHGFYEIREEKITALFDKVAEELGEARKKYEAYPQMKGNGDVTNELGDVLGAFKDLCASLGNPIYEVEEAEAKKRFEKGGFSRGMWGEFPDK